MNLKTIIFLILTTFLWVGCQQEELSLPPAEESSGTVYLRFDLDEITETYGPALTRSIESYNLPASYPLPGTITSISTIPTREEILPEGEERIIVIMGSFSIVPIRVYDAVNQQVLDQTTVTNQGGYGTQKLVIPPFQTTELGAVRVLFFQYMDIETLGWKIFEYGIQSATQENPFMAWTNLATDISADGASVILHISGGYPASPNESVLFRVVDQAEQIQSNIVAILGTTVKSAQIDIEKNISEEPRILYFQYARSNDLTTWTTFESHIQSGYEEPVPDYNFIVYIDNLAPQDSIPFTGKNYQIMCMGNIPLEIIRIRVSNDQENTYQYYTFNDQSVVAWECPANQENSARNWTFEYSIDNNETWIIWQQTPQTANPENREDEANGQEE